jgi:RHS repeat-associated protein
MLTDEGGKASATFSYGAYGQPTGSTGSQTTPLGYAGELTNEQSGLQYLRARVYDPATGQFLTRDPIEALTRQPYPYVFDNPLNLTDPSGLEAIPVPFEAAPECAAGPVAALACAGAGATACAIISACRNGVGNLVNHAWHSIFSDDDSGEERLTLTKAEEEYEEKHHECKIEEQRRAERGVPSETRTKDREFTDKLSHPNDPNNPQGGSKLIRIVALIARLLHHQR